MGCQAFIVSPDLRLHNAARNALKRRGIAAAFFSTPDGVLLAFREQNPDVFIIDLSLPRMAGVTLCERVRRDSLAHILVIGPPSASQEGEVLLRLGADSFHTRPIAARHLAALVAAALRRRQYSKNGGDHASIRVGTVELDLDGYEVRVEGRRVNLTPTQFRIFTALAKRPGQVLTRTWLVEELWGRDPVEERSVGSYISRLRMKLTEAGASNMAIVYVPGAGYALFTQPEGM